MFSGLTQTRVAIVAALFQGVLRAPSNNGKMLIVLQLEVQYTL
jgi:hypothetical protein